MISDQLRVQTQGAGEVGEFAGPGTRNRLDLRFCLHSYRSGGPCTVLGRPFFADTFYVICTDSMKVIQ